MVSTMMWYDQVDLFEMSTWFVGWWRRNQIVIFANVSMV